MTDDRWVYEPVDPDDCHLHDCLDEDRRIRGIVAVVNYDGLDIPMHPDCARRFSKNVAREELEARCRVNARWN